jgi:hypothetical protein
MNRHHLLFAATLVAVPGVAFAQQQTAQARPELFEALVRCRAIADDAERLQCFDTAAANLQQAEERRDLVVVDRQQVRENRRRLFGLPLPDIGGLFGNDEDDEVDHIESTVASASQVDYGRWLVRLEDGSTWLQTDNEVLAARPRPGQRVRVNRASLGTYMMRVNNQPGIRVRRSI